MRSIDTARCLVLAIACVALANLGADGCNQFRSVRVDEPTDGELLVGEPIAIQASVGTNHDPATIALAIDGVDLVASLGLVPPFVDAAGVVLVGGDPVQVTELTLDPTLPGIRVISGKVAGLPLGAHDVTVSALRTNNAQLISSTISVDVLDGLLLDLPETAAAGLPGGPVESTSEGTLANAALGQALAAPPVLTLGGDTIRSGHVSAAEQVISAGGP